MYGKEKNGDCLEVEGDIVSAINEELIQKQVYINHQKLFSFKTSRGNYPQFLWHVRYVNDLEYLSVSEQLIKLQWAKYIVLAHFLW